MNKRDAERLVTGIERLCDSFETELQVCHQTLMQLQESSGAKVEEVWALRDRVKRAKQKFHSQRTQLGFDAWRPVKFIRSLQNSFPDRPDLAESVEDLLRAFDQLDEVLANLLRELLVPYVEKLCNKLEPNAKRSAEELRRLKMTSSGVKLQDCEELERQMRPLFQQFEISIARATHQLWRLECLQKLGELLSDHPHLFGRVEELWKIMSSTQGGLARLKRPLIQRQRRGLSH
jgi:hypothetical protein